MSSYVTLKIKKYVIKRFIPHIESIEFLDVYSWRYMTKERIVFATIIRGSLTLTFLHGGFMQVCMKSIPQSTEEKTICEMYILEAYILRVL